MLLIGITGTLCSGKGVLTEYFNQKGFYVFSLSDILRNELKLRGEEITREKLQNLGNEFREKYGHGALAIKSLEFFSGKDNVVIESIRNPGEVEELRKHGNFSLIAVDAPRKTRALRILTRHNQTLRDEDPVTEKEILERMEIDEGKGQEETGQQVKKCLEMADYHIFNDSDMINFKFKADEILSKITNKNIRPSWDEYFMLIAKQASKRATCDRKHIGAIIVKDKTILATGYNGSISGFPHCDDIGHMIEEGHCVATVHAEANAILQAAKNGVRIEGSFIYTTASPCWACFKLIANSGIKKIVFGELYRDERIKEFSGKAGIELVKCVI